MENQNFILAETIDPRDAEIESLRQQVASADAAATRKSQELDAILSPLFSAMESRFEALAEEVAHKVAGDAVEGAFRDFDNDFNIREYQSEIEDIIDDRLPAIQDEDDHREAVEAIVRDILSGATVTIDV